MVFTCPIQAENILIKQLPTDSQPLPSLVLADFGLATLDPTKYTGTVGTLEMLPPELTHSPLSDVWALGATVHYMIHCKYPIAPLPPHLKNRANVASALEEWLLTKGSKQVTPVDPKKGYSKELVDAMMRCLQIEAMYRTTSKDLVKRLSR